MNERTKEIASQVLDELVPETWTALGYDKIKEIQFRTAELIVRECVLQLHRRGVEGFDILEERNLKEHFGVEE